MWLGLFVAAIAGCETTPQIDWAARVGHYTYDDAVKELGPPASSAKLADGTLVADWLMRRGRSQTYVSTGPGFGTYPGPSWQTYSTSTLPDRYIRLTFGPDGNLTEWKPIEK